MHTLAGYDLRQELYRGATSTVYRGTRRADGLAVILKVLNQPDPSPDQLAQLQHEYELLRDLRLPGVAAIYALEYSTPSWYLVLEDFGGVSLAALCGGRPMPLARALEVTLGAAECLGQIHRRRVVHKNINPTNLVLHPATGEVKLIDFGIASREGGAGRGAPVLEGTLAYIAPEQTARTSRPVDYRADFYSLGVTLYELLTGRLPFPAADPLDLIHSHLAKAPPPPHTVAPDVPQAVSDLVLKLMAKDAADRYQSAFGLAADIEECLSRLRAGEPLGPFTLGARDVPDRFAVAREIVGRERETAALLAAFEQTRRGAGALLLIAGDAGVGKSALVETLLAPITEHGGTFLAGKFDQLQRNIPYSALIQTFRALGRRLLAEGAAELSAWRARLHAACGANLAVIAGVVPEVELIVGPQPSAPELGATEAQHRFALVVEQFITVFATAERPLVLVLDDLQWADGASLQMLERLFGAAAGRHLLVIGAYRDDEVGAGHPLRQLAEALGRAAAPLRTIRLAPLDAAAVARLVAATLHCAEERAAPLAALIVEQTGGNPFFVGEVLRSLYADGLIAFDYQRGQWRWDPEQIGATVRARTMLDLLTARVQRLGGDAGSLLQVAACLGGEFSLSALATAADRPPDLVASAVAAAAADGLIVAAAEEPRALALETAGRGGAPPPGYRFVHDRVQQAVYELVPAEARPALHWRVGERLWRAVASQDVGDWLFVLVNQLGLGRACVPDPATGRAVAELHLLAGRKARAAAAYEPAWRYFRAGMALLDDDAWAERYELARDLHGEAARAAYLAGDYATMEALAEAALRGARSLLDAVDIYEARIQAYAVQNRMQDAVRTALDVLRRLGIPLSERPGPAERRRALAGVGAALAGRPVEALGALPAMEEPTARAAIRILAGVASAAYNGSPALFGVLVAQQVTLSIAHGTAPESAFAYAAYAILLCGGGDIGTGAQFGRLAAELADRPEAQRHRGRTRQVVHTFVSHWQEPLRSVLPRLRQDYHIAMEVGDVEFAAYALDVHGYGGLVAGVDLERLSRDLEVSRDAIARINQATALNYLEIFRQAVANLRGDGAEPWRLAGPIYDMDRMVPLHLAANDRPALFFAHTVSLMLGYLWRRNDRALADAEQARVFLDGGTGSLVLPLFTMYDALARLAQVTARAAGDGRLAPEARPHLRAVGEHQRRMRRWAEHAPENQLHRWHLVEAERLRVTGRRGEAREAYDRAIALARQHGYQADEALACELAGAGYAADGLTRLARAYLSDARDAWAAWGAAAKARDLAERYADLLAQEPGAGAHALDVTSVFRASHAIASELVLDRLLTTIMQIVIENAGARRGGLLRGQPGQWIVEAEVDPEGGISLARGRQAAADELPISILNYVAHTQQHVVIDDVTLDEQFSGDPYVAARRPRSVLCAPLLRQGTLLGLLYLENDLSAGVFTPDRVEIVSLLAGQVAVSIENAGLYSHLEDLVAARTGELTAAYDRLKALNDRLQTELTLARHIQEHLLLPAHPAWAELDVCCASTPAREVGGDFYLYHAFPGPSSRYALVVGDVSGKGMPAALVMAISLGLFQTLVWQGLPPATLLAQLDRALAPYTLTTRQNCALVYVDVARAEGAVALRVANAGGVTPLIKRRGGAVEWVEVGGLPLGISLAQKPGYQDAAIRLEPGDLVVLVSDGVIEASDERGELFGFERFEETVGAGPQHSAEAMLRHIQAAVVRFGGAAEPHDDMTVVVVRP